MIVIIEIFVAHQALNPLADKVLNTMFDITLITTIDETAGKIP